MPTEGYRNDKEYISDYLRLLSAENNKDFLNNDIPFNSEMTESVDKKSTSRENVEELKNIIRLRTEISWKEGKKFGLDKVVEHYKLSEVQKDIILTLLVSVIKGNGDYMSASKILQIVSKGNYERMLDRVPLKEMVKKGVIGTDVHSFPGCGSNFSLKEAITEIILGEREDIPCTDMSSENKTEELLSNIKSPREIYKELDKYVVGQEEAKRTISVGVYNHFKRIACIKEGEYMEKSNILLIGPTGSGKTFLVRTLAKILGLPVAISEATGLTQSGYVGDDVEVVLWRLYEVAEKKKELAEMGIVYIDEIDKIARTDMGNFKSAGTGRDVGGLGIQRELLKIMEGTIENVPLGGTHAYSHRSISINTSCILFIMGGAFSGLDEIIRARTQKRRIGFDIKKETCYSNGDERNELHQVTIEDLISYGFIPEFLGRLPVIAVLNKLSHKEFRRILLDSENALLKEYKILLAKDGIDMELSEEAIDAVIKSAMENDTGARGLRSIVEKIMTPVIFENGRSGSQGKKVVIDKKTVENALR